MILEEVPPFLGPSVTVSEEMDNELVTGPLALEVREAEPPLLVTVMTTLINLLKSADCKTYVEAVAESMFV
jgi:hypothetical protein